MVIFAFSRLNLVLVTMSIDSGFHVRVFCSPVRRSRYLEMVTWFKPCSHLVYCRATPFACVVVLPNMCQHVVFSMGSSSTAKMTKMNRLTTRPSSTHRPSSTPLSTPPIRGRRPRFIRCALLCALSYVPCTHAHEYLVVHNGLFSP